MLSGDERVLLRAVLRARPRTEDDLVALAASCAPAAPERTVATLVEHGFLTVSAAGAVTCRSPEAVLGRRIDRLLADAGAAVAAAEQGTAALLDELVGFVRDDGLAGQREGALEVEYVHGPEAPRDASIMLMERRGPVTSCAVLPDSRTLQAPPADVLKGFVAMLRAKPEPDRVLLGPIDAHDEGLTTALGALRRGRAQFRVSAHLPGWFAVDADDWVALPATWGEAWPSSVVLLRHAAVAGALRALFESLWVASPPFQGDVPSWEPLLALLGTGATVPEAADVLGISERTARRWVAEAMKHHRVHTLFQLGAAAGRPGRR